MSINVEDATVPRNSIAALHIGRWGPWNAAMKLTLRKMLGKNRTKLIGQCQIRSDKIMLSIGIHLISSCKST